VGPLPFGKAEADFPIRVAKRVVDRKPASVLVELQEIEPVVGGIA
jgi:hypothetical protein